MKVTLRVKKVYFDQILNRSKNKEIREYKDFYHKIFKNKSKIKKLKLHYQGQESLIVNVKRIYSMIRPFSLKNSVIKTNKIYVIQLGNIESHNIS